MSVEEHLSTSPRRHLLVFPQAFYVPRTLCPKNEETLPAYFVSDSVIKIGRRLKRGNTTNVVSGPRFTLHTHMKGGGAVTSGENLTIVANFKMGKKHHHSHMFA